jgi:transcriptional regulator with XRE-family HTH domain
MKATVLYTILKRIGLLFSDLRIKKGFNSIKDFAHEYNLSLIQYWRIEKGKANITLKTLIKLLAIHRLSLEDFFCKLSDYA